MSMQLKLSSNTWLVALEKTKNKTKKLSIKSSYLDNPCVCVEGGGDINH